MSLTIKQKQNIFIVFAMLFGITTVYHLIAVFFKINDSTQLRNLIFVGINIICIYGILKRPKWFVFFFATLFVQQCYSHGTDLYKIWMEKGKIDWISILDLVMLPTILFFLIEDFKKKKSVGN